MFADDMDDVADSVLLGGKDTVSICLITGFESFNISLYNKVFCTPVAHLAFRFMTFPCQTITAR